MMAQNDPPPAFERPGGEGGIASPGHPIDFTHLSRQTMGDRNLEQEILALFIHQANAVSDKLADADNEERIRLAHMLKGSSRSVGAFPIGDCAALIEAQPQDASGIKKLRRLIAQAAELVASVSR